MKRSTFKAMLMVLIKLYMLFDADISLEQLLINLVFRTTVRLHSIKLVAPDDGMGLINLSFVLEIIVDTSPAGVKLFANIQNPGFSDVDDSEPSQKIPLSSNDFLPGNRTALKVVKFLHVNR
jgi:hypothetical protein